MYHVSAFDQISSFESDYIYRGNIVLLCKTLYGPVSEAVTRNILACSATHTGYNRAIIYTETIKLCPLDVYVCQFQMFERISFKFSPYKH